MNRFKLMALAATLIGAPMVGAQSTVPSDGEMILRKKYEQEVENYKAEKAKWDHFNQNLSQLTGKVQTLNAEEKRLENEFQTVGDELNKAAIRKSDADNLMKKKAATLATTKAATPPDADMIDLAQKLYDKAEAEYKAAEAAWQSLTNKIAEISKKKGEVQTSKTQAEADLAKMKPKKPEKDEALAIATGKLQKAKVELEAMQRLVNTDVNTRNLPALPTKADVTTALTGVATTSDVTTGNNRVLQELKAIRDKQNNHDQELKAIRSQQEAQASTLSNLNTKVDDVSLKVDGVGNTLRGLSSTLNNRLDNADRALADLKASAEQILRQQKEEKESLEKWMKKNADRIKALEAKGDTIHLHYQLEVGTPLPTPPVTVGPYQFGYVQISPVYGAPYGEYTYKFRRGFIPWHVREVVKVR